MPLELGYLGISIVGTMIFKIHRITMIYIIRAILINRHAMFSKHGMSNLLPPPPCLLRDSSVIAPRQLRTTSVPSPYHLP